MVSSSAFAATLGGAPILRFSLAAIIWNQNSVELMSNSVGEFLRGSRHFRVRLLEQASPQLSSVTYINQFHVQEYFIIAPNHFSRSDCVNRQVLPYGSRFDIFLSILLNRAVSQDRDARSP